MYPKLERVRTSRYNRWLSRKTHIQTGLRESSYKEWLQNLSKRRKLLALELSGSIAWLQKWNFIGWNASFARWNYRIQPNSSYKKLKLRMKMSSICTTSSVTKWRKLWKSRNLEKLNCLEDGKRRWKIRDRHWRNWRDKLLL